MSKAVQIFYVLIVILKSAHGAKIFETCKENFLQNTSICYHNCPYGSFSLPGMKSCQPWLQCDADVIIMSLITISVVKTVYLGQWNGYMIVISVLSSEMFEEDFLHNLYMIKLLSLHKSIVNLLGYCENSILTEYYELGNALNTHFYLKNYLKAQNNIKTRINLCISYVSIIELFHNSSDGIRIMCDSNTLEKTLSQYLLTVDLQLVANDLDATPKIEFKHGGVHCGSKDIGRGDFVAPEQIWPYPNVKFDIRKMPYYDEKTDIFKIPNVCNWFIGNFSDVDLVKYKLHNIHQNCKKAESSNRPSASVIYEAYKKVLEDFL